MTKRNGSAAGFKLAGSRTNPQPDQLISHDGLTLSLKQWASRLNRSTGGLYEHIRKVGLDEALARPNSPHSVHARKCSHRSPWRTYPSVVGSGRAPTRDE